MCWSKLVRSSVAIVAPVIIIAAALLGQSAFAAVYTWDASASSGSPSFDGSGTWSLSASNWWNGAADQLWTNSTDTALFGAAAGSTAYSVTASTNLSVGGLVFQSQAYALTGGSLTLAGASPTITVNAAAGNIASVLAGTNGLTMSGTGTLMLSGINNYAGGTTITGGMLSISQDPNLGAVPGSAGTNITLNGGALQFTAGSAFNTATINTNRSITLGNSAGTLNVLKPATGTFNSSEIAVQYRGAISGAGNLTVTGGTGTNTGTSPYLLELGATNSYTGTTTVNNAIVCFNNGFNGGTGPNNILPTTTVLNLVNNGWFSMNNGGVSQTIAGLSGDSTGRLATTNNGAVTFTIDPATGQSYSFAGVIGAQTILGKSGNNGAIAITVNGPGTEVLTGANTYTGATTITAGTLMIGGAGALGNTTITNNGSNNGQLTFNNTAAEAFGGVISGSGGFTQSGTSVLTFTGGGNPNDSGPTTVSGGTLLLSTNNYPNSAIGSGPLTINSGAALIMGTGGQWNLGDTTMTHVSTININGGVLGVFTGGGNAGGIAASTITMSGGTIQEAPGAAFMGWAPPTGGTLATNGAASTAVVSANPVLRFGGNTGGYNMYLDVSPGTVTGGAYPGVDLVISGVIQNDGNAATMNEAVIKNGAGVAEFTANNTYAGNTTINGGTLDLANAFGGSAVGSGTLTINSGGAAVMTSSNWNLGTNTSTHVPAVVVNGGLFQVYGNGQANGGLAANTIIMTGGTIQGTSGNNQLGWQTPAGTSGTLATNGATTTAVITADPVMRFGSGNNLTLDVSQGTVASGPYPGVDLVISGIIQTDASGNGLVNTGAGVAQFTGEDTYSGPTTISAGTLVIGGGGSSGSLLNSAITNNATLAFSRSDNVNQSGISNSSGIAGTGGVVQLGPGSLTLDLANNYSGGTVVQGGTLALGNALALGGGSAGGVTVSGGVFDLAGVTPTTASNLSLTLTSGTVTNSGGAASFPGTSYSVQSGLISAVLAGSGALTKNSLGLVTLTAANTYSGATTVSAGTLALGAAGTLGGGNVTIQPGGVLDTTAYGSSGYNFAGVLTAGRTASYGTDINGTINFNSATLNVPAGSTSVLSISGSLGGSGATWNYSAGDQIALGGAISLSGTDYIAPVSQMGTGTYTLFTYNNGTPNLSDLAMSGVFGTNPRQTYTFGVSGGTAVTLAVVGVAGDLQWSGVGNVWYTGNSSTANWYNTNSASADYFYTGDNVTFSDTGSSPQNITISGTVQPASLTVSNTAVAYSFSGTGSIAGATSLVKNGPGTLTIATSNSYTGGTSLTAGVLNANAANALGTGSVTVVGGLLSDGAVNSLGSGSLSVSGGTVSIANPQSVSSVALSGNGSINANAAFALGMGSVTVSGGLLSDGAANSLGSGPLSVSGGTVNLANSQSVSSVALTGNGTIDAIGTNSLGSGGLTVAGGMLTVGSSQSPVSVGLSAGTIYANAAFALGTGSVTVSGGLLSDAAANSLGSGPLSVSGGTVNLANPQSVSSIALSGSGLLNLGNSGATGTGTVTISGGSLDNSSIAPVALANNNPLNVTGSFTFVGSNPLDIGAGAVTIANSPTVFVNASTLTVEGAISGNSALTKNGAGMLVFTGNNSYAGATTVSAGTLMIGGGGVLGNGNYSSNIVNNGQLTFNTSAAQTLTGTISGSGALTQSGANVLTMTGGSSSYNGGTTVSGGTLQLNTSTVYPNLASGIGTGPLTINSGGTVIMGNANWDFGDTLNPHVSYITIIAGLLQVYGNGQTNGGLAAYSITMTGGTIQGTSGNNQLGWQTPVGYAGTLNTNGAATTAMITADPVMRFGVGNNWTLNVSQGSVTGGPYPGVDLLISGIIQTDNSGNGLVKTGAGVAEFTGVNTYTGATTVSAGTLVIGDGGVLGNGNYSSNIVNNGQLTFNTSAAQTLTGTISGSGALTQSGANVLTITGNNTYNGGTVVQAGVLQLGNSAALGTGALSANGGTLDLEGNSIMAPSFSGAAGVVTDYGTGGGTTTLTVNQSITSTFGGTLADGPSNLLSLVLTGGTLALTGTNSYSGGTTVNDGTLVVTNSQGIYDGTNLSVGDPSLLSLLPAPVIPSAVVPSAEPAIAPVPEPGTLALLTAAIGAALASRRMRRR